MSGAYAFSETAVYEGQSYVYTVYAPPQYIRGRGMNGLFVLLDAADDGTVERLLCEYRWKETADAHNILLFFLPPPRGVWKGEDAGLVEYLYGTLTNWWVGGYSVLTSQRYVLGIGGGAKAAAAFCGTYSHQIAAAVLVDAPNVPGEKEDTTGAVPIRYCPSSETVPALAQFWPFLSQYLKIKINNDKGVLTKRRSMEHLEKRSEKVGGLLREWYVFAPANAQKEALPLVIALHGITSNGRSYLEQTRWDMAAEKYHFAVIAPTGFQNRWNAACSPDYADEVAFVSFLINDAAAKYVIDLSRVYVSGFSMGAAMVHRLMADCPFTFAAGAAFSGQLYEKCDDRIMVQADCSGKGAYTALRNDIPRALWQFYGDKETVHEYPGDRAASNAFWQHSAGADSSGLVSSDGRLALTRFEGAFFEYRSTAQLDLGHAYYADLHEMVYTQLFSKCQRRNNPITAAGAVRNGKEVRVHWELAGEKPRSLLLVPVDGFAFSPIVLKGDSAGATLNLTADRFWLLPFYQGGTVRQPFEVAVASTTPP